MLGSHQTAQLKTNTNIRVPTHYSGKIQDFLHKKKRQTDRENKRKRRSKKDRVIHRERKGCRM